MAASRGRPRSVPSGGTPGRLRVGNRRSLTRVEPLPLSVEHFVVLVEVSLVRIRVAPVRIGHVPLRRVRVELLRMLLVRVGLKLRDLCGVRPLLGLGCLTPGRCRFFVRDRRIPSRRPGGCARPLLGAGRRSTAYPRAAAPPAGGSPSKSPRGSPTLRRQSKRSLLCSYFRNPFRGWTFLSSAPDPPVRRIHA